MIYYAGIGSRKTPWPVCHQMHLLAQQMAEYGLTLRSGHALRADQAFEAGCVSMQGKKEIYLPVNCDPKWKDHAAYYHPAWNNCDEYAKLLHGRNSAIMLGPRLDKPVKFVACWTHHGLPLGGTGQALRIAKAYEIPVFNFATMKDKTEIYVRQFLEHVK